MTGNGMIKLRHVLGSEVKEPACNAGYLGSIPEF